MSQSNKKVGIGAYISLLFAVIFFSGIMVSEPVVNAITNLNTIDNQILLKPAETRTLTERVKVSVGSVNWVKAASVLDFNKLNGTFGNLLTSVVVGEDHSVKSKSSNFAGTGGAGARQGFMFALTLIPTVMFALGMVAVLEFFGALDAMRQILSLILRPIMGIPGEAGLAMIASLQSTDAGGAMTRSLYDEGKISEKEKEIFTMFQFSAGGPISNFLSSGAALLALTSVTGETVPTSLGVCFAVMFVMKFFGANLFRIYINFAERKQQA